MPSTNAVEFISVSKSFGAVKANQDLNFKVSAGSIHGIIGENGAGKSTAMKLLFGLEQPDTGEIKIRGQAVYFASPVDAMHAHIGMVHQHFMLAEPLTALDNILLHQEGPAFAKLPRKAEKERLQKLAERYGFDINLDARVGDLSVGAQQRIEILKILSQNSEILILDEPTAVLTPREVQDLFTNLRRLKAEGKTILIITHKLKEVMAITDEVTVFRAGKVTASFKTSETHTEALAEAMVGRRLVSPSERKTTVQKDKTILNVQKLSARLDNHGIDNVDLQIYSGEIVGVAGVEGNGQDVLIRSILDPQSVSSFAGSIQLQGREIQKCSSLQIREQGVGAFPEDRLRFGVLAGRPADENFLLGQQRFKKFKRGLFLNMKKVSQATAEAMEKYDIRPRNPKHFLGKMSGGNQQKLVVARELSHSPSFVLAAQPTRGVDIGAVEFIHNQLRLSRDQGAGVLLISSELDELMALSDRILVLCKGHLMAEFSRSEFDEIRIGTAMGGGQ